MATQFSGGTYVSTTFATSVKGDVISNLRSNMITAGWTAVSLGVGLGPGNIGTVTITIAAPGVVTFTSHGFLGGEPVILATTGALPTGLTAGTTYFVKFIDANTFNLATTLGGSNITTTGSQSGTHTLYTQSQLMESATQTNVTNAIRIRIKDNATTGVQLTIEAHGGTPAGTNDANHGATLQAGASFTYRLIATKYQIVCCLSGTLGSQNRDFVAAGMLYVPGPLATVSDHGYLVSDTFNATDSSGRITPFRGSPTFFYNNSNGAVESNWTFIWNSNIIDNTQSNSLSQGTSEILVSVPSNLNINNSSTGYRWSNDDLMSFDPLVYCGLTVKTDEGKIKGQLFDMVYIMSAFTIDSTDTFNGHNWFNLSNNNTGLGNRVPNGGLWIATS